MTRTRIATAVAVLATGLFLLGCGAKQSAGTWQGAPAPAAGSASATTASGTGGGEAMEASMLTDTATPSTPNMSGVLKTTGGSAVALTFDDGPDPTYTPAVLALLRKYQIKATFCLIGVNVQAHPELVRAIVDDGHTLCNHTWKHDLRLGTRGEAAIRADLQRTNDAIQAAVPGAKVTVFRHPGGMWTPTAVSVAASMGMKCAGWDVDPSDWNVAKWPAGERMKQHVLSVLRSQVKPGSIVLTHDAGGDRRGTLAAYEVALPELAAKFQFTTL
jgi:peptidoglycan-N-acetylglucosamine deacetylase